MNPGSSSVAHVGVTNVLNLIPRTSTWEFWNSGSPISLKTGQKISEYIVQLFDVNPTNIVS
jgi:hypothetical protein